MAHHVRQGDLEDTQTAAALQGDISKATQYMILTDNYPYTVVDASMTDRQLSRMAGGLPSANPMTTDLLAKYDVKGVYPEALPFLLTQWTEGIANRERKHLQTHLLQELGKRAEVDGVHLRFTPTHIYLAVLREDQLLYCNAFEVHSADEIVYYILVAYETSGYDSHEIPLYLYGMVERGSSIVSAIRRYIYNVQYYISPECMDADYYMYWAHYVAHRALRLRYAHH